jgi:hypothetical protein
METSVVHHMLGCYRGHHEHTRPSWHKVIVHLQITQRVCRLQDGLGILGLPWSAENRCMGANRARGRCPWHPYMLSVLHRTLGSTCATCSSTACVQQSLAAVTSRCIAANLCAPIMMPKPALPGPCYYRLPVTPRQWSITPVDHCRRLATA